MKYVVILGDGMADYPIEEIGGKTPLDYARTPNMDRLAASGRIGLVKTVPDGFSPGSDVANLSVMGFDPRRYYTGRSPLEAIGMGVSLNDSDITFRCNLVTLSDEADYRRKTMVDYCADEITTAEAAELIDEVNRRLGNEDFRFYAGVSYRHLMVWNNGPHELEMTPPHDISGRTIGNYLPRGEGSDILLELMMESYGFLGEHPVNRARMERGLKPANSLWFWGQGRKPVLPPFSEKFGLTGAIISAVDLTKGIGKCAGLEAVNVPGATGNIRTNFRGKALAALEQLEAGKDFVYIHIEAPDEAGHRGELETKIKAIEEIDEKVVGEVWRGLEKFESYRIMVLCDHFTPLSLRTHVADPVPFAIYQKGWPERNNHEIGFNEQSAVSTGLIIEEGYRLMDHFIKGEF
ncbi:cofactor-independent phosphoglycerate mutase [Calderihabitans maritimus]|uniref:Proposed homoserine kinase n=1 Tax=Calderihabitans maritimus TaxID=1246530 RepID=A0A1Z5HV16_9FIRM|nr:cofactor-independent phosphoglycerate mutase [Calderihabitans maritimus]GAW93352.1 proposed homoserine kinase [Calderihabitans maritimus]